MKSKILFISLALFSVLSASADYKDVQCSSDPVFEANSCNQCFVDPVGKKEGDSLGLLKDTWTNSSTTDQIAIKDEVTSKLPFIVNLAEWSANWVQNPDSQWFWQTTAEFDALYSESQQGNVLKAGQSVQWLESKLGYAYTLDKNSAPAGANIGLLVYPFTAHTLSADGKMSVDDKEHRECVIFKSDAVKVISPEQPQQPQQATELPKTGPEHIILLLVAMLIGTGLVLFRKKA